MMRRGIGRVGRPSLVGTMARTAVVAGTATAVAGGMSRRQQGKAQQAADAQAYEQQQQQAADRRPSRRFVGRSSATACRRSCASRRRRSDVIAQLTKLGELKAQGILTDAEFEAQKAKLLGS